MTTKFWLGSAAAFAMTAGLAIPTDTGHAQGFRSGYYGAPIRYWDEGGRRGGFYRSYDFESESARRPRVEGPQYYTYRPDELRAVSFANLAEVQTASTGSDGTAGSASDAPAPSSFAGATAFLSSFRLRVLPEVGEALRAHYAKFPRLIWSENGEVSAKAREAIAVLKLAGGYGLDPQDYAVELPGGDGDAETRRLALIGFDLELSARVLSYVLDATRGRIDPKRISGYHDFERKKLDLADALRRAAEAPDIGSHLDGAHPRSVQFRALVSELARLRASDGPKPVEIAEGTFIRPGDTEPELANVVAAIGLAASAELKAKHAAVLSGYAGTPEYTPELVGLVRAFQSEKGMKPDGIVGARTIAAMKLEDSKAAKVRKVELAMERLRWLPRELGARHVFINQPAFTATYMHEGREPLSMRVVIGTKANQTYFFSDKIETVEYNPYWGVPRSIIVNEMMPNLMRNPSYLDRMGYQVTDSRGRRIPSSAVDWHAVATNRASVDVRQPPGRSNALGALKIMFPNAHAIYMHDTPHKELFKRDMRAFSHGCVRLHDPKAMAAAVLDSTVEQVDSRIAKGKNDVDKVAADVQVHVAYFTAWPEPNGEVRYFDDVYGRDGYLARAIARTEQARKARS